MCDCLNYYYDGDYFVIVVNVYYQEHRQKTSKLSQTNVIADNKKKLKTVHFIKLVRQKNNIALSKCIDCTFKLL